MKIGLPCCSCPIIARHVVHFTYDMSTNHSKASGQLTFHNNEADPKNNAFASCIGGLSMLG